MGSEANGESQTASGQCVLEMCHLQHEARCAALSKTVPHEKLYVASSLLSKETIYRRVKGFHTGRYTVYLYIYIYIYIYIYLFIFIYFIFRGIEQSCL